MDFGFCNNSCKIDEYPTCVAKKIISSVNLDDIINKKRIDPIFYPVCHSNSQSFSENKLKISGKCNSCGLCRITCSNYKDKETLNLTLEKVLLSNLNLLNIYFSTLYTKLTVATEIKTEGNSRDKRIDFVIKNEEKTRLIKVLSNIDKLGFYSRSYEEILETCRCKYQNLEVENLILVSETCYNKNKDLTNKLITINSLQKLLEE